MIVNIKIGVYLLSVAAIITNPHTTIFFISYTGTRTDIIGSFEKKKDLVEIALINALCYW